VEEILDGVVLVLFFFGSFGPLLTKKIKNTRRILVSGHYNNEPLKPGNAEA
jgi:hypothetical protein